MNLAFRALYRLDNYFHRKGKTGPVPRLVCTVFESWLWRVRD